jgi:hypothetical protein
VVERKPINRDIAGNGIDVQLEAPRIVGCAVH